MRQRAYKYECYDSFWLYADMRNMGVMFSRCEWHSMKFFNTHVDVKAFIDDFMISDMRYAMDVGHPRLLSQSVMESFELYVKTELGGTLDKYKIEKPDNRYYEDELYWMGYIYAYIHFMSKLQSDFIYERLPFDFMLGQYNTGHQLSNNQFYERIKRGLK